MRCSIHIEGPGVSRTVEWGGDTLHIGRGEDNDIVLAGVDVSKRHARLRKEGPCIWVEDLASRNGTWLDGKRLAGAARVEPSPSLRFLIGGYQLEVRPKVEEASESETSDGEVAWEAGLRKRLHDQLIEALDLRRVDIGKLQDEELRQRTEEAIDGILERLLQEGGLPLGFDGERLRKELADEALGLGPLEELLADDGISEVMVNGPDRIYVERDGKLSLSEKRFSSDGAVLSAIERIVARVGRRIDEASPMVDARWTDGSRVSAIIPPLSLCGPCITIRKFRRERLRMEDLVTMGALDERMARFFSLAVAAKRNIVISGGTGSGKTTLLNILTESISEEERIITVEDAAELQIRQPHWVRLEARPPNMEGKGAVTIRELVMACLRMRPDRIVVGECRGGEALDMLQAMNTGHDGSLTTLHANSPRDAVSRLETLCLMAGMDLPMRAIRDQIASAVDLIIQQSRMQDGSRKITSVSEVVGMEGDTVVLQEVFRYDGGIHRPSGFVPRFCEEMLHGGASIDPTMFLGEAK